MFFYRTESGMINQSNAHFQQEVIDGEINRYSTPYETNPSGLTISTTYSLI